MSRQSRGQDAMPNHKMTPNRAPSKIGDPHEHKKEITSKKEKVRTSYFSLQIHYSWNKIIDLGIVASPSSLQVNLYSVL
jgi:hypothetical protein